MKKALFYSIISTVALLTITWFGCQKEYNPSGLNLTDITTTSSLSITEKVTASLQGRVFDENGKPASGVTIKAATVTTTTDVNGSFSFTNIQLSKNAGFVSIEKTGYFKTYKTFLTSGGTINYVEARLIPRASKGTFAATAGGTITFDNSNVKFAASSVVNAATNVAYTGTVNVYAAYLDPSNSLIGLTMPGNLTGLDTSNKLTLMRSLGMMVVELEGAGGEKLQIANEKTATISSAIPTSLMPYAPATIPLWYFDETLGLWRQQGSATKQGNSYVGDVPHFSFWNCDVSVNSITIKINLKNQNGQAIPYAFLTFNNQLNNSEDYGFSNSLGTVTQVIPQGSVLQLNVYDKCGGVLFTKAIGPYFVNTNLGTIAIPIDTNAVITINGSVVNCLGNPVTNSSAEIKLDGNFYRASLDASGKFAISIKRCSNALSQAIVVVNDPQTNQFGTDTLNVQSGVYNVPIKVCGSSITEFIDCTINGTTYHFTTPIDVLSSQYINSSTFNLNETDVYGNFGTGLNPNKRIYIHSTFIDPSIILNPIPKYIDGFYFRYVQDTTKVIVLYYGVGAITNMQCNITEYGKVGQYITGSFSGNVMDSTNNNIYYPMTCSFRAKRIQ